MNSAGGRAYPEGAGYPRVTARGYPRVTGWRGYPRVTQTDINEQGSTVTYG